MDKKYSFIYCLVSSKIDINISKDTVINVIIQYGKQCKEPNPFIFSFKELCNYLNQSEKSGPIIL